MVADAIEVAGGLKARWDRTKTACSLSVECSGSSPLFGNMPVIFGFRKVPFALTRGPCACRKFLAREPNGTRSILRTIGDRTALQGGTPYCAKTIAGVPLHYGLS